MVRRTEMIEGSSGEQLDPRITPFRPQDRVASVELEGVVAAETYLTPTISEVISASVPVRIAPDHAAERVSTLLRGERVKELEVRGEWAWVQCLRDNQVGYVERWRNLSPDLTSPTHKVAVPTAVVLEGPDVEYNDAGRLGLGALVTIDDEYGDFARVADFGWLRRDELVAPDYVVGDWVALGKRLLLNVPYLWGGSDSARGYDCSGFLQRLLLEGGYQCPRDTDLIDAHLDDTRAKTVHASSDDRRLMSGDIVVWQSHIGVMVNGCEIMHCCPWRRRVLIENLSAYEKVRLERKNQPIKSIKRLLTT